MRGGRRNTGLIVAAGGPRTHPPNGWFATSQEGLRCTRTRCYHAELRGGLQVEGVRPPLFSSCLGPDERAGAL